VRRCGGLQMSESTPLRPGLRAPQARQAAQVWSARCARRMAARWDDVIRRRESGARMTHCTCGISAGTWHRQWVRCCAKDCGWSSWAGTTPLPSARRARCDRRSAPDRADPRRGPLCVGRGGPSPITCFADPSRARGIWPTRRRGGKTVRRSRHPAWLALLTDGSKWLCPHQARRSRHPAWLALLTLAVTRAPRRLVHWLYPLGYVTVRSRQEFKPLAP
jgi:hypothetical protein